AVGETGLGAHGLRGVLVGRGGDAVDHGGDDVDVVREPGLGLLVELGEHGLAQHLAVAGEVVAGDQGDRLGDSGLAAGLQAQRDAGGGGGGGGAAGRVPPLGAGQGDHGGGGGGEPSRVGSRHSLLYEVSTSTMLPWTLVSCPSTSEEGGSPSMSWGTIGSSV